MAGYSARTEADEQQTLSELEGLRKTIIGVAQSFAGRIFNTAGDGFMLEFTSSQAAVEAALELADRCHPKVRVGVHLGNVAVQSNGDLLGHGVNVAARLMAQAAPGSALISVAVRQSLHGPLLSRFVSRGVLKLDKMNEAIEAFAFGDSALVVGGAAVIAAEPLVAVLPFDNLSADPEMQFFSDGVSEEILQTVARSSSLKVIGRGSSFQFRGPEKAASHVAAQLKATHVLDGSVRRSGSRVRIAANLIECATETTVWAQGFDRELSDIFALQDEIGTAVAKGLKTTLAPSAPAGRIDPAVYELFLQANKRQDRVILTPATLDVLEMLEQVVKAAPDFARAWGKLAVARSWILRAFASNRPASVSRASVVDAAETALRLDPNCAAAYRALRRLEPWGCYAEREALNNKALSVAPNDPEALGDFAGLCCDVGRIRDALGHARLARELDPLSPIMAWGYAFDLDFAGRYDLSRKHWQDFMGRWPEIEFISMSAIAAAAANADWTRFDEIVGALAQRSAPSVLLNWVVEHGRALRHHNPDHLNGLLGRAEEQLARTGWVELQLLANLHALGAREETFDLIDRATYAHMLDPDGPPVAGFNPPGLIFSLSANKEMMRDRRFVQLCAKLHLIDYWTKTEHWPDCADDGVVPYDFKTECRRLSMMGRVAGGGDAHAP
jgi:TolB-like protein